MYSRILFVTALFGVVNAVHLGANQADDLTRTEKITINDDVDTLDDVHTDFTKEVKVEGRKKTKDMGEVDFQKTKDMVSGKTGEYTADDGTTFVTGAKEKDMQKSKRNENGKVA